MDRRRIFVVDDDAGVLATIDHILGRAGHDVASATTVGQGLARLAKESFDLLISDIVMPAEDGLDLIRKSKTLVPQMAIIAMSGGARIGTVDPLASAREAGADLLLPKPFDAGTLLSAVTQALAATALPHRVRQ